MVRLSLFFGRRARHVEKIAHPKISGDKYEVERLRQGRWPCCGLRPHRPHLLSAEPRKFGYGMTQAHVLVMHGLMAVG